MPRLLNFLPIFLAASLMLPGAQAVEPIATAGPSGLGLETPVPTAPPAPPPAAPSAVAGQRAAPSGIAVAGGTATVASVTVPTASGTAVPGRGGAEGQPSAAVLLLIGLGMLAFSLRGETQHRFAPLR
ncbi:MAG: hypothetical protein V4754_14710 [Pseudomonadota bacterium]